MLRCKLVAVERPDADENMVLFEIKTTLCTWLGQTYWGWSSLKSWDVDINNKYF